MKIYDNDLYSDIGSRASCKAGQALSEKYDYIEVTALSTVSGELYDNNDQILISNR